MFNLFKKKKKPAPEATGPTKEKFLEYLVNDQKNLSPDKKTGLLTKMDKNLYRINFGFGQVDSIEGVSNMVQIFDLLNVDLANKQEVLERLESFRGEDGWFRDEHNLPILWLTLHGYRAYKALGYTTEIPDEMKERVVKALKSNPVGIPVPGSHADYNDSSYMEILCYTAEIAALVGMDLSPYQEKMAKMIESWQLEDGLFTAPTVSAQEVDWNCEGDNIDLARALDFVSLTESSKQKFLSAIQRRSYDSRGFLKFFPMELATIAVDKSGPSLHDTLNAVIALEKLGGSFNRESVAEYMISCWMDKYGVFAGSLEDTQKKYDPNPRLGALLGHVKLIDILGEENIFKET